MVTYLVKAKELLGSISAVTIEVVPRSKNANVYALTKLASTKDAELLNPVFVEFLAEPSLKQRPKMMELKQEPLWMDPIIAYLKNGELPKNKTEVKILSLKAAHYVIYDDKLYRRGYLMPLLKCVTLYEVDYIMRRSTKAYVEIILGGNHWHSKHSKKGTTGQR